MGGGALWPTGLEYWCSVNVVPYNSLLWGGGALWPTGLEYWCSVNVVPYNSLLWGGGAVANWFRVLV